MEGGSSSNADGDDEIHFPEPLIHLIQSFLDAKQAAQTTLLSKSWYASWLIRPNVDLDERHFRPSRVGSGGASDSAPKSADERNLPANGVDGGGVGASVSASAPKSADERDLPANGAAESDSSPKSADEGAAAAESDSTPKSADVFWEFVNKTMKRYEDLNIKIDSFRLGVNTAGSNYLSLSTELISKIIQANVEDITLCAPPRAFSFDLSSQVLESESLIRLSLCGWYIREPRNGVVKLSNLKSLTIEDTFVGRDCFSLVFPCLEDLTFRRCSIYNQFTLSSCSLKRLTIDLDPSNGLWAIFDVPNIRKVKFAGSCYPTVFPDLTILTVSWEWESDVSLYVKGPCPWLSKAWPSHLKRFMNKLSGSKIIMNFTFGDTFKCNYSEEDLKGKQGPIVEDLILSIPSLPDNCARFLAGLLWCSPPKFLTMSWFPGSCLKEEEKASNDFIRFLCEELVQDGERCSKIHSKFDNHGLGKVNIECCDSPNGKWQPLSSNSLLDDSWSPETTLKVRFHLEWCASSDNVPKTVKASSSRKRARAPAYRANCKNSRRRLNPPSSATSSLVNCVPSRGSCIREVLQEYSEILGFLKGARPNERALNRVHQRVELCIKRVSEELGIEFPPLDNANDSTSGNYIDRTYDRILARAKLLLNRISEYYPNDLGSGNSQPSPSGTV